jgi:hypothetical protein
MQLHIEVVLINVVEDTQLLTRSSIIPGLYIPAELGDETVSSKDIVLEGKGITLRYYRTENFILPAGSNYRHHLPVLPRLLLASVGLLRSAAVLLNQEEVITQVPHTDRKIVENRIPNRSPRKNYGASTLGNLARSDAQNLTYVLSHLKITTLGRGQYCRTGFGDTPISSKIARQPTIEVPTRRVPKIRCVLKEAGEVAHGYLVDTMIGAAASG